MLPATLAASACFSLSLVAGCGENLSYQVSGNTINVKSNAEPTSVKANALCIEKGLGKSTGFSIKQNGASGKWRYSVACTGR